MSGKIEGIVEITEREYTQEQEKKGKA